MSNNVSRAEKSAIKNPLKIDVQDIKQNLLKQGNINVEEKSVKLTEKLKMFVSAKFQWELDYFLKKLEPSNTEIGQRLASAMKYHLGNFFEALITVAISEE